MFRDIVSLAFVTVVLMAMTVPAQERHDGHTWTALSRQMKIFYIEGMTEARH